MCAQVWGVFSRDNQSLVVQEPCESRGGRPGLSVLTSLLVSVDVKQYWTMLAHWSQLVPNIDICQPTSEDIKHHLKEEEGGGGGGGISSVTYFFCLFVAQLLFNNNIDRYPFHVCIYFSTVCWKTWWTLWSLYWMSASACWRATLSTRLCTFLLTFFFFFFLFWKRKNSQHKEASIDLMRETPKKISQYGLCKRNSTGKPALGM